MTEPLKLGMIGFDTSHVIAFAAILNDPEHPNAGRVTGEKVRMNI